MQCVPDAYLTKVVFPWFTYFARGDLTLILVFHIASVRNQFPDLLIPKCVRCFVNDKEDARYSDCLPV